MRIRPAARPFFPTMPPSNFTDDLPTEREPSDLRGDSSEYSYIWSTTGSGKTLTSFKASTLLKDNPDIVKCLFVVDRKDLDRQTREELNCFERKEEIVLANRSISSNQSGEGTFESAFGMKTSSLSQRATA